eukprot:SM000042S15289  [mRNA]  locus=s42:114580:124058:+ [translate_table: standard]
MDPAPGVGQYGDENAHSPTGVPQRQISHICCLCNLLISLARTSDPGRPWGPSCYRSPQKNKVLARAQSAGVPIVGKIWQILAGEDRKRFLQSPSSSQDDCLPTVSNRNIWGPLPYNLWEGDSPTVERDTLARFQKKYQEAEASVRSLSMEVKELQHLLQDAEARADKFKEEAAHGARELERESEVNKALLLEKKSLAAQVNEVTRLQLRELQVELRPSMQTKLASTAAQDDIQKLCSNKGEVTKNERVGPGAQGGAWGSHKTRTRPASPVSTMCQALQLQLAEGLWQQEKTRGVAEMCRLLSDHAVGQEVSCSGNRGVCTHPLDLQQVVSDTSDIEKSWTMPMPARQLSPDTTTFSAMDIIFEGRQEEQQGKLAKKLLAEAVAGAGKAYKAQRELDAVRDERNILQLEVVKLQKVLDKVHKENAKLPEQLDRLAHASEERMRELVEEKEELLVAREEVGNLLRREVEQLKQALAASQVGQQCLQTSNTGASKLPPQPVKTGGLLDVVGELQASLNMQREHKEHLEQATYASQGVARRLEFENACYVQVIDELKKQLESAAQSFSGLETCNRLQDSLSCAEAISAGQQEEAGPLITQLQTELQCLVEQKSEELEKLQTMHMQATADLMYRHTKQIAATEHKYQTAAWEIQDLRVQLEEVNATLELKEKEISATRAESGDAVCELFLAAQTTKETADDFQRAQRIICCTQAEMKQQHEAHALLFSERMQLQQTLQSSVSLNEKVRHVDEQRTGFIMSEHAEDFLCLQRNTGSLRMKCTVPNARHEDRQCAELRALRQLVEVAESQTTACAQSPDGTEQDLHESKSETTMGGLCELQAAANTIWSESQAEKQEVHIPKAASEKQLEIVEMGLSQSNNLLAAAHQKSLQKQARIVELMQEKGQVTDQLRSTMRLVEQFKSIVADLEKLFCLEADNNKAREKESMVVNMEEKANLLNELQIAKELLEVCLGALQDQSEDAEAALCKVEHLSTSAMQERLTSAAEIAALVQDKAMLETSISRNISLREEVVDQETMKRLAEEEGRVAMHLLQTAHQRELESRDKASQEIIQHLNVDAERFKAGYRRLRKEIDQLGEYMGLEAGVQVQYSKELQLQNEALMSEVAHLKEMGHARTDAELKQEHCIQKLLQHQSVCIKVYHLLLFTSLRALANMKDEEIAASCSKTRSAIADLARIKVDLAAASERNVFLSKSLEELQNHAAAQLATERSALQQSGEELASLNAQMQLQLQTQDHELSSLQREVVTLAEVVQAKEAQLAEYQKDLTTSRTHTQSLEGSVHDLTTALAEKVVDVMEKEQIISNLRQQVLEKEEALDENKRQQIGFQAGLEEQMLELKRELKEKKAQDAKQQEEITKLCLKVEKAKEDVTKQRHVLEMELAKVEKSKRTSEEKLRAIQRAHEDMTQRVSIRDEQLQKAEEQQSKLLANLQKAEKEVSLLGDEVEDLRSELQLVDDALNHHKEAVASLKGMRAIGVRIKGLLGED